MAAELPETLWDPQEARQCNVSQTLRTAAHGVPSRQAKGRGHAPKAWGRLPSFQERISKKQDGWHGEHGQRQEDVRARICESRVQLTAGQDWGCYTS